MKPLFFSAFLVATLFSACIEDESKVNSPLAQQDGHQDEVPLPSAAMTDTANYTSVQWLDQVKELGSIREGQKLEVSFRFVNTGKKPLVIESAQPSCGCTVPEKPEKPIMPGQEGMIKAVFDSNGRSGSNHKTITVVANTTGTTNHVLEFNVNVIKKDGAPAATGDPAAAPQF
jgi:hypothetical protein